MAHLISKDSEDEMNGETEFIPKVVVLLSPYRRTQLSVDYVIEYLHFLGEQELLDKVTKMIRQGCSYADICEIVGYKIWNCVELRISYQFNKLLREHKILCVTKVEPPSLDDYF